MIKTTSRASWVAIITGTFSVAIGIIYLLLITALDARGPMLPPPPEALIEEVVLDADSSEVVPRPFEVPPQETS